MAAIALVAPSHSQAKREPGRAPVKTIRIKNARTIQVVLGRTREAAAGVRPDKDGWKLLVDKELDGSLAELQDVTPAAKSNRWTVTVADGALPLGLDRFLPTHVYRVVFLKERRIVGSALVYLYAPPTPSRRTNVDFAEESAADDPSAPIAPSPKGNL